MVDRLIEELRTRERCLHAEAEVYMESQLRYIYYIIIKKYS